MRFLKILALILVLALALPSVISCDKDEPVAEDVYYTVTFDSAGGSSVDSVKIKSGGLLREPAEPEKEGYIFSGWRNGTVTWIFGENKVNSDLTLTASWIDATTVFQYTVNDGKITITKYIGNLSTVKVPTNMAGFPVSAIGENAFVGTDPEKTGNIILGENITSVGANAFSGCEGISITVEGALTSVGEKAFYGCDGLTSVTIGEGAEVISYGAFANCTSLKSATLASTVKTIDENAFQGCLGLQSVMLHSTVRSVGDSAFLDCEALKAIYYYGTAEEWLTTEIAKENNGNAYLLGADLYIYSEEKPAEGAEGQYWHFEKNGKIRIW